ncbi:MAG TPA: ankyrin repeat domain-containing protein [Candidatus Megaira endosymbiont of Nemacystus decipiens]|nr:ankyrin repeat domain-containing protein [Candidatus Megaera endosymbiont of Nemacystus decipiens]
MPNLDNLVLSKSKSIIEAKKLYLRAEYGDAYKKYLEIADVKDKKISCEIIEKLPEENRGQFALQVLKTLNKLEKKDGLLSNNKQLAEISAISYLIKHYFPEDILDRALLVKSAMEYYPSGIFEGNFIPEKYVSVISYINYFQNAKTFKDSSKIFMGTKSLPLSLYSFDQFLNISNLQGIEAALTVLYKFGMSVPILLLKNDWGDTVAHKLVRSKSYDGAIAHLECAAKFHESFLEKYLYKCSNHQNENLLQDISSLYNPNLTVGSKNLIDVFTNILSSKKLEHFLLFERLDSANNENYMQFAARFENFELVKNILHSAVEHSKEVGFFQRTFNVNAGELSLVCRSKIEALNLLRSVGMLEHRDQETNKSYMQAFSKDSQNLHRSEFREAIKTSFSNLEKRYKSIEQKNLLTEFEKFFHSINDYISEEKLFNFLQQHNCRIFDKKATKKGDTEILKQLREFKIGAEYTLARILPADKFSNKYDQGICETSEDSNFPHEGGVVEDKTLQDVLAYTLAGINDKNALKGKQLSDEDVLERKLMLTMTLYDVYKEGKEQTKELVSVSHAEEDSSTEIVKIGDMICLTGLFDRILCTLDHVHDSVKIKVQEPEMKMTYSILSEKLPEILKDIDAPLPLLVRIYNNFENLKQVNVHKQFVPLNQYFIGLLKTSFKEQFENFLLGNKETNASNLDYIAFEDCIMEMKLPNPLLESMNIINGANINTIKTNMLGSKILMHNFDYKDNLVISSLFKASVYQRIAENLKNKTDTFDQLTSLQKERLDIAIELSADHFFNNELQELASKHPISEILKNAFSSFLQENQNLNQQTLISEIDKMIHALAKSKEWAVSDILQFNAIIEDKSFYSREKITTDLMKNAVINENLLMLGRVLNKAEEFYEGQISNEDDLKQESYTNPYLVNIAKEDFGYGSNILHIAAIHCTTLKAIFDSLLHFHEFRDKIDCSDEGGRTAIYTAALLNNNTAIEKLVEYGADVNKYNNFGDTPIHVLANDNNFDSINYLIEHGANPFARDNSKNTFVHNAASNFNANGSGMLGFEKTLCAKIPIAEHILYYDYNYISEILGSCVYDSNSESEDMYD